MNKLSDLKRDVKVGTKIELLKMEEKGLVVELNDAMKGIRTVVKVNTTGFYLRQNDDNPDEQPSFCGYPRSSNFEAKDNEFTIIEKDKEGNIWQKRFYKIVS